MGYLAGLMRRRIRVVELASVFQRIRRQAELPMEFPEPVIEEAESATSGESERADLRSIPFVTIDPPQALDLDQAMALEHLEDGRIRLRYAIADLAAFVAPGSAIDREARRRGRTVYCPDRAIPLHPPLLSEGAASLLPGVDRPAVVFEIDIASDGTIARSDVRRALVRSRERFDYRTVQAAFDVGDPPQPLAPLEAFGRARIERGIERGALTLRMPEQEAVSVEGRWTLACRPELAVERWNAEVSLITGMVAAEMMVGAGTGVLRTLPTPGPREIGQLRGAAKSLGVAWTRDEPASEFLAGLDPSRPRQLAVFESATHLLRGAGYLGFSGGAPDGDISHGGLAAPYAHVTAPLRRLVDRFTLAACVAIAADQPVPAWVEEAVEEIPELMGESDRRGDTIENRCIDAVEAWVMDGRIGDVFEAVVLDERGDGIEVWIDEPPIMAWADGIRVDTGKVTRLEVTDTDVIRGIIRFAQAE